MRAILRHPDARVVIGRCRALIGMLYPTTYFMKISVGTFTKGLGFEELLVNFAVLCIFVPALTLLSLLLLKKQES